MTDHPIIPPPELVHQWRKAPEYITELKKLSMVSITTDKLQEIATQAARWGADQELDACVEWIRQQGYHPCVHKDLRADRRPKLPPETIEVDGFTYRLEK